MSRNVEMNPIWFAKMWCQYRGDLFRIYYGCHRNYTLTHLISMYKKVKNACPKLPQLIVKNEDWETCPAEFYAEIKTLTGDDNKRTEKGFCERFAANRQINEKNVRRFKGKAKK